MKVSTEALTICVPLKDMHIGDAFILPSSICGGSEIMYIKTDHSTQERFASVVSLTTGIAILVDIDTLVIPADVTVVSTPSLVSDTIDATEAATSEALSRGEFKHLINAVTKATVTKRQFKRMVKETIEDNYSDLHDAVLKIVKDSFKIRYDKYSVPVPPCDDTKLMDRRVDDIIIKIQEVICNGKTS